MQYRRSKQRDIILNYMQKVRQHLSAEQIYEALKGTEKEVSLATVYRNLGILEEMGEIKKLTLKDGVVYDATSHPHYHFYCKECKKLFDLPMQYHMQTNLMLEGMVGQVDSHELTFKGICKNCM